jgi:hypothetical protein
VKDDDGFLCDVSTLDDAGVYVDMAETSFQRRFHPENYSMQDVFDSEDHQLVLDVLFGEPKAPAVPIKKLRHLMSIFFLRPTDMSLKVRFHFVRLVQMYLFILVKRPLCLDVNKDYPMGVVRVSSQVGGCCIMN